MTKLHIFNPEHDMALAANLAHFTPPHAGRQLRHDLGFLPALWAEPGDMVLVDDVGAATESFRHLGLPLRPMFVDRATLTRLMRAVKGEGIEIRPWGWDVAVRQLLCECGVSTSWLSTPAALEQIRQMSHRGWAAVHLLPRLVELPGTVGEAWTLHGVDEMRKVARTGCGLVLKSPWSSSGRGVRYVSESLVEEVHGSALPASLANWFAHVLERQGCVMAEPYYNKVVDFGMEFVSDGLGGVDYSGLSLFHTVNGAYVGNVVDTEEHKEEQLVRYVSVQLIRQLRKRIAEVLGEAFGRCYQGRFGVDMMVVRQGRRFLVHPCVELNLRMTMGHAALALADDGLSPRRIMRISCTDKYRLRIENCRETDEAVVQTDRAKAEENRKKG